MRDFSGVYMLLIISAIYTAPNLRPETRNKFAIGCLTAAVILAVLITTKEFFK